MMKTNFFRRRKTNSPLTLFLKEFKKMYRIQEALEEIDKALDINPLLAQAYTLRD
ncbi:unnamed protein product [Paramecium sonneborni]|uniref:Tetratricopeptide repeat protein n=1 Tax=Paramecium sonneborni TaxID=65129 RepID=A0A8S1RUF7_9CILI|nr:unnamed protein product [Paramecium sonneborni]